MTVQIQICQRCIPTSIFNVSRIYKNDTTGFPSPYSSPLAEDGAPPLSKRQQKKLAKKDWNAQKKAEKKIAKKQNARADSAKRKAQIDEALAKMTPEELEEHRNKAYAKSQVILLWNEVLAHCM